MHQPGKALARGIGSTKKSAEQDAARRALERLKATGSQPNEADTEEEEPAPR